MQLDHFNISIISLTQHIVLQDLYYGSYAPSYDEYDGEYNVNDGYGPAYAQANAVHMQPTIHRQPTHQTSTIHQKRFKPQGASYVDQNYIPAASYRSMELLYGSQDLPFGSTPDMFGSNQHLPFMQQEAPGRGRQKLPMPTVSQTPAQ